MNHHCHRVHRLYNQKTRCFYKFCHWRERIELILLHIRSKPCVHRVQELIQTLFLFIEYLGNCLHTSNKCLSASLTRNGLKKMFIHFLKWSWHEVSSAEGLSELHDYSVHQSTYSSTPAHLHCSGSTNVYATARDKKWLYLRISGKKKMSSTTTTDVHISV